ncbi:MAG: alpha/beta hydrolase [Bacteroidota bacterium]
MSNPKVYMLSGLGADERVFQLLDFTGFEVVYVQWITPHPNESIQAYAARLLQQIDADHPILIGLSFGGMMAIEIAKLIPTQKIILISSAKTRHEIPFYLKQLGKAHLDNIVPAPVLKQSNAVVNWFFGVHSVFEKELLRQILNDMEPVFLKWAIHQVLNWQNELIPHNLVHIHGTSDRLLPARFVKADHLVNGGGHFMVLSHSALVSQLIKTALAASVK